MDVELLQFLIFISFQNNIYHIVTWNGYSKWPLNEANELTVRWIDNREWSGRVRKRRKKTPQEHWWWILWLNMGPEFHQTKTWIDSPALMAGWWLQYFLIFHFIYGMSSFPYNPSNWWTHIFQDGHIAPPTRWCQHRKRFAESQWWDRSSNPQD